MMVVQPRALGLRAMRPLLATRSQTLYMHIYMHILYIYIYIYTGPQSTAQATGELFESHNARAARARKADFKGSRRAHSCITKRRL